MVGRAMSDDVPTAPTDDMAHIGAKPSLLWWLPEYPPDPGGIATFAGHVVPGLVERGHNVFALVLRGDSVITEPTEGFTLQREPFRLALESGDPLRVNRLRSTTRRIKQRAAPDVYHVHLCEPSPFLHVATLDTAPAPTVLTIHNEFIKGFDPDDDNGLTNRLFRTSSIVTCVSTTATRALANDAVRFSHRVVPIPNGTPVPAETTPVPVEPRLVAVGRLAEQKGFDRLLRSMPAIVSAVPDVHLDILGAGPAEHELLTLVDSLDLSEHVTLHGHVDRTEVGRLLDRSRLVVAPSRYEGLPYAALEAAGHGRAIVATGVAGLDEVVDDGVTGVVVDNERIDDDPQLLADAIISLLAEHGRCVEMGRAGRERTMKLFSLDACLDSYEHVYRAVTQRRRDVAVMIPVFNGERHLGESIESALAAIDHAGADAQVIVIDDGSTDASAAIAATYADRGVELFSQPNLGVGLARNTGIALTNSEWIAALDADDVWPVDRLEHLLSAAATADANGDRIGAVYGCAIEFADADAPEHSVVSTTPTPVRMITAGLVRRSSFDRIGGHTAAVSNDQVDWGMRAVDAGIEHVSIDDLVLQRRIHANNKSHQRPFLTDTSRVALVKEHLDRVRQAQLGAGGDAQSPR